MIATLLFSEGHSLRARFRMSMQARTKQALAAGEWGAIAPGAYRRKFASKYESFEMKPMPMRKEGT